MTSQPLGIVTAAERSHVTSFVRPQGSEPKGLQTKRRRHAVDSTPAFRWEVAGGSIKGPHRAENQDAFFVGRRRIAVFDGVGGHARARQAAQAAREAFAAARANLDMASLDARVRATRGATTAALVFLGDFVEAQTVGDTMVYLVRGGDARPLTPSDGSGNVVSQCLGIGRPVAHHARSKAQADDRIVACTDGVHGVMSLDELVRQVRAARAQQAVATTLELVLARGAPDNATIVVAHATATGGRPK